VIQDLNDNNFIDDLLVKYLLDESTREERKTVEAWLGQDAANQRYYDHFSLIWEQSKSLAAQSKVDTDAAWQRFQQRVSAAPATPGTKTLTLGTSRYGWMKVAASMIFLVSAGWLVYFLSERNGMQVLAANDQVRTDTLPDGSVVTLNKHATLKYAADFNGATRPVTMEGEAFFDIAPDKSRPFIIAVNGVKVKVVGTSFNIKSTAEKTEVIVETGVVEVSKRKAAITLTAHEQAIVLNSDSQPIKAVSKDELYNYYRTKEFVCNNTPLWRLVDVLNEAYDTNIVIGDEKLKHQLYTATFHDDSLENILAVIGETFNISIEKDRGRFILKAR
jgi:transmembrane sensor